MAEVVWKKWARDPTEDARWGYYGPTVECPLCGEQLPDTPIGITFHLIVLHGMRGEPRSQYGITWKCLCGIDGEYQPVEHNSFWAHLHEGGTWEDHLRRANVLRAMQEQNEREKWRPSSSFSARTACYNVHATSLPGGMANPQYWP